MDNEKLVIIDTDWNSLNEAHFESAYEDWNVYSRGSSVMSIQAVEIDTFDRNKIVTNIDVSLDGMVNLYKFLGKKLEAMKENKYYMQHFTDAGEYKWDARPHLDPDYNENEE